MCEAEVQYIETLTLPVLALMALGFLYSSILRTLKASEWSSLVFGLLFGTVILFAMTFPIPFSDGFILDLRSLLVGWCVVFCGWRAGLLAVSMGVIYRIYLGGGGMLTGTVALISAYMLGLLWRRYAAPHLPDGIIKDALFGGVISLNLMALFLLPYDVAIQIFNDLALYITIANVVGSVALSFVLRRETQYFSDAEQLRIFASVDPLTNLLNRRGTQDRMAQLDPGLKNGSALLYFDVDHFKTVNDTHGHAAGDAVLATIAGRIEGCMREHVILSRHGGDEFTLFIPNVKSNAVEAIAKRINSVVNSDPVHFQGQNIPITVSIGCYWTKGSASFDSMLRVADQQLMNAKKAGRNCAHVAIGPGSYVADSDAVALAPTG